MTGDNKLGNHMKQWTSALFVVGAIMLLTGAAVYVTGWTPAPYIYTVGATLVALAQFNTPLPVETPVLKRLRRQQLIGALLLIITGGFMLYTHGNEWIVSLTIAAVLQLYTAFRMPQEIEKNHS